MSTKLAADPLSRSGAVAWPTCRTGRGYGALCDAADKTGHVAQIEGPRCAVRVAGGQVRAISARRLSGSSPVIRETRSRSCSAEMLAKTWSFDEFSLTLIPVSRLRISMRAAISVGLTRPTICRPQRYPAGWLVFCRKENARCEPGLGHDNSAGFAWHDLVYRQGRRRWFSKTWLRPSDPDR